MKKEAIVRPKPFKDFKKEKIVFVPVYFPPRFLQKFFKIKASAEKDTGFGLLYRLKDKAVLYRVVGAPAAVISLERFIASGAKEILILGICGSLNPKFRMTSAVSISRALSCEGTSRLYFPRKKIFHPSALLKKKVLRVLMAHHFPFQEGSIVSTDAPYRETKPWLNKMKQKGIDLVDMEVSAVFSLAEFYEIEAAALMIVSDELFSGRWEQDFSSPELEKKIKDYFLLFL